MADAIIVIHYGSEGAEAPQVTVDDSMPIPRKFSPTSVNKAILDNSKKCPRLMIAQLTI